MDKLDNEIEVEKMETNGEEVELVEISDYDIDMIIRMYKSNMSFNGDLDELILPTDEEIEELMLRFELINLNEKLYWLNKDKGKNYRQYYCYKLKTIGDILLLLISSYQINNLVLSKIIENNLFFERLLYLITTPVFLVLLRQGKKLKEKNINISKSTKRLRIFSYSGILLSDLMAIKEPLVIETILTSLALTLLITLIKDDYEIKGNLNVEGAEMINEYDAYDEQFDQKIKKFGARPIYYGDTLNDPNTYLDK